MQSVISPLDRFLIAFATQRWRRVLAWAGVGLVLALARSWFLIWLAAFVPLAHFYGAWVLKHHYPCLRERLAAIMEAEAREACGLPPRAHEKADEDDEENNAGNDREDEAGDGGGQQETEGPPVHLMEEASGSVGPGSLAALPDTLALTLVAPMEGMAVVARRTGTIFPPRWLHPLEFRHHDDGLTEIYYADVNYVDLADGVLTLHFSNGDTFELGRGQGAREAVAALRERLRRHKSAS